jgi:uncharacterized protein YuzE
MTIKQKPGLGLQYDRKADAAYVRLSEAPYARGEGLDDSRRIDYGEDGRPVGIELLNVSLGVRVDGLPRGADVRRLLQAANISLAS